jgi:hypothetical protein
MVMRILCQQLPIVAILAQQQARPVLERLDPRHRALVIADIFLLVLVGLSLVAGVMIGARWVRRLAREKPRLHSTTTSATRLANQRLRDSLGGMFADVDTSATVEIDASSDETKIDRQRDSQGNL